MWTEYVNTVTVVPRSFPRASAVAERLWSDAGVNDARAAAGRMQEHECRMMARGYRVQPSDGAAFCYVQWPRRRR